MAIENPFSLFPSGKKGYLLTYDPDTEELTEYPFGDWAFAMKAEFVKRNNFMSRGYQEGVDGFRKCRFTIKGPYAKNSARLIIGVTYRFYLGIDSRDAYEFYADGMVVNMNVVNTAEGAPEIDFTCESNGAYTMSIASDGADELTLLTTGGLTA